MLLSPNATWWRGFALIGVGVGRRSMCALFCVGITTNIFVLECCWESALSTQEASLLGLVDESGIAEAF